MIRVTSYLAATVAFGLAIAGCGSATTPDEQPNSTADSTRELTVYAAASLVASFGEIGSAFHAAHPDINVLPMVFDGSSTLATQIAAGAPADVFASADERSIDEVSDSLDAPPEIFATNVLTIAVAPGNPLGIAALADLARPDITTVLCAPEVPCGNASATLLTHAQVTVTPASEEQNVKAVLTKVAEGEADAGLVYETDVAAAEGQVDGIAIAGAQSAVNRYALAPVAGSGDAAAAKEFVTFVLSAEGQKILASYGFGTP